MHYVRRTPRDSSPVAVPLLLAIGSLGLLAIVWRRAIAPRFTDGHVRPGDASERPPAPSATESVDAQAADTGSGALIHRQYEVVLPLHALQASDLLRLMQRHLTELAPTALAEFEKSAGSETVFAVGDEYDITMLGPWNGRVRVCDLTANAFTLITLDGHPEAGHITFTAEDHSGGERKARVRIESWARARDAVVNTAYATLGIGKQVQAEVWITFLQRLGALAGVTETPQVRITTEEMNEPAGVQDAGHRDA